MPLKAGAGSILGYCLGTFAKLVTIVLIWWIGLAVLFLAWLNYMKYISVHWRRIDADIFWLVAKAREGGEESTQAKVKKFVTHYLPLTAAFTAAFYYGFKYGS